MSSFEHDEALYRMTSSVGRSYSRCTSQLPTESAGHRQASNRKRCCKLCGQKPSYRMANLVRRSDGGCRSLLPTESAARSQARNEHRFCKYCGKTTPTTTYRMANL